MINYVSEPLTISLSKGRVFKFDPVSGTGKTYFGKNLNIYNTILYDSGVPSIVIKTKTDYATIKSTISNSEDGTLVILDRLDLFYNDKVEEVIEDNRSRLYFIADSKFYSPGIDFDAIAYINLDEEGVTLTDEFNNGR